MAETSEMAPPTASTIDRAAAGRPGWGEWFWRSRRLEQARRAAHEGSEWERSHLRHALAAAELAGRVLDGTDPLRAEPGYWLAISLYREATYWLLLAQRRAPRAAGLVEAFEASPRSLLEFAAGGAERLQAVRDVLLASDAQALPEADIAVQRERASLVREFVAALVRVSEQPDVALQRVIVERWLRTAAAVAASIALVVGAVLLLRSATRPPDLALGKPWRVSSSMGECRPAQHSCVGSRTDILFHTKVETNPWFELDLGDVRSFSVIEIQNRGDCCLEVVLPLAVEVSEDAQAWREVARQTEVFDTWRIELPPQRARYVRARAMRRTALHLERVSVFEH
jgi:hypothetical protein